MNLPSKNIAISDRVISAFFLFIIIGLIGIMLLSTNVLGSSSSSSTSSNLTDSFWTNASRVPTPRSESGVAILEDRIYVVGGESQPIKKTNVVEVYDLKTKVWTTVAPLPLAMNHVGLSSYDGKLYAVGGTHDNGYSDKLFIYDPKIDKWYEGKSMPAARTALTVNFIDGKLYVIGGRLLGNGIPRPINEGLSNFNDNEMYNPANDTWITLEQMPSKRSGLASASFGDYIYVFGGQKVNGTFENNERYDTKKNVWTTEKPLPTPRLGLEAITIGDDIYVVGGKTWYYFGGNVEIFHPKNN